MRITGVLLLGLLTSAVALADTNYLDGGGGASEAGNGGDVVVCPYAREELLDFYEGRTLQDIHIDLGGNLSVEEKLDIMLERIRKFDTFHYERLKDEIAYFWKNSAFLPGIELIEISDSKHVALPVGCRIQQIAVQRKPRFPKEKYYIINKDLWDDLYNDQRAGLIMHEILFKEALASGHSNSIRTRYLNAMVASPAFDSEAGEFYRQTLQAAEFNFPFLHRTLSGWWHMAVRKEPFSGKQENCLTGMTAVEDYLRPDHAQLASSLKSHGVFGEDGTSYFRVNDFLSSCRERCVMSSLYLGRNDFYRAPTHNEDSRFRHPNLCLSPERPNLDQLLYHDLTGGR